MRPIDFKPLAECLSSLADVFNVRPPSEKAIAVWADTLRDFPIERIESLLRGWPKVHAKMPVPKDVWTVLNDERTEDIERSAVADKMRERNEVQRLFDPRVKDANMSRIRQIVSEARSRGMPTGAELARRMLEEAADGEKLNMAQRAFVQHNLGWTQEQLDRLDQDAKRMTEAA
jgi:hypothetical protein